MSFEFDFTQEKVAHLLHKNKEPAFWFNAMNTYLPKFGITTPARVAGFVAQGQHESGGRAHADGGFQLARNAHERA